MHALTGYCDRWSVRPGQRLRFMVSSAGGRGFGLRFVRHVCADPNPDGPGYEEVPMATAVDGNRAGVEQHAYPGSYGVVEGVKLEGGGLTLSATVWPTTPAKGRQGVLSVDAVGWRLSLGIGPGGGAMLEAAGPDGGVVRAEAPRGLRARRWYDLEGRLDAAGGLRIVQRPHAPLGDAGEAMAVGAPLPSPGTARVLMAALPGDPAPLAHYNGKLERPMIAGRQIVAAWDFSVGIPTQTATDTGPHGAHAGLVNLPSRAMTGSNWTGDVHDWKSDPAQYGAIHFHDDDIGDLGWAEAFGLEIPGHWPSGFYAAHLRNEAGEDYIPFFVRPVRPSAAVAVLVPTFSYQIYGCYVRPGRGAEIAERAREWGALPETPDMNPQFGLSCYNHHSDGSGVAYATMFRPMLDTRPRQVSLLDPVPKMSGTGRVCADSYIVRWLTGLGQDHDVITDHDLHEEGMAALAPYRVVIAAQHPEYHSGRMMQALAEYLGQAGRLMYLGGNGFYWRAEPSEHAPGALEMRRAEGGIRVWETFPGESYHAFGGGYGGLWRRIGRPAHALVGNGFSVQGRHLGFPYRFTEGIRDRRAAFMAEGLEAAPGAAFGEAGYMGGGAAGFELDSVNAKYGTPPHALVVAKGVVIDPDYGPVNEDMLTHRHPRAPHDWSCADMVFFETPAGGAVFSVGSMTYVGSLNWNGGENTLSRLTGNVLRRFIDETPFTLPTE